jgi:hypothetical protein
MIKKGSFWAVQHFNNPVDRTGGEVGTLLIRGRLSAHRCFMDW